MFTAYSPMCLLYLRDFRNWRKHETSDLIPLINVHIYCTVYSQIARITGFDAADNQNFPVAPKFMGRLNEAEAY